MTDDDGVELTRRSFLAGMGSVTVGLLFRRQLDAVLDSLERDLVAEQQAADQQPSAADIVVVTDSFFRAERLVVPLAIAPLFVIENVTIGRVGQFAAGGVSADMFTADAFDAGPRFDLLGPGMEMRFRVSYIGKDPAGARFTALLYGSVVDSPGQRRVLPIDSVVAIVS